MPAGEVQDIVEYLEGLAGGYDTLVSTPEVLNALRKWYESHKQHIILPDGRKAMCTTVGYSG